MPINVQGNPTITVTPSGTQSVKIVSWDSSVGPVYIKDATTIGATGTGLLVIGIQSGATTARGWVFTTTGAGFVSVIGSLPAGNQVVGTMVVSSIATIATGTVSVVAISTTADSYAIPQGGSLRYLTASTGVQYLRISITTSGDSILVTSAANKSIAVLSLWLNGNGANSAVIASSVSAVPLGGPIFIATSGVGMVLNNNDHGWFRTTVGHSLVINLASSGSVAGSLTYVAVTT